MSMMQEMLADMLKKALPPEVVALMTPEKIKEFGDNAAVFIEGIKASLERIEQQNETILERLNLWQMEQQSQSKPETVTEAKPEAQTKPKSPAKQ